MKDPVFVKSPYGWESYSDFWHLVRLSGFDIVDAVDLDRDVLYVFPELDVNIMLPLQDRPAGRRRARCAFWGLERPDERVPEGLDAEKLFRDAIDEILGFADEMWVSDRSLTRLDGRLKLVALGSHPGLAERVPGQPERSWDVVHVGQTPERRRRCLDAIRARGVSVVEPRWGNERTNALSSARMLLAIHRTEGLKVGAPLRWALAGAFGLPVVSESLADPWPLEPGVTVRTAPIDDMVEAVLSGLSDPALAAEGLRLKDLLCARMNFRSGVEAAVKERAIP